MSDINGLAKERIDLQQRLAGIAMWNTYGRTVDELTEVEVIRIETLKRLSEIRTEIDAYKEAYCDQVVPFCAQGYSLTAFAGEIGVCRDTITEWADVHPEFSLSVKHAKAACARWWEDRLRGVALDGGPGGQATAAIFGVKNHAPHDFADKTQHEHTGPDGGPMAMTIEDKRAAALALLETAFGAMKTIDHGDK